MTHVCENCQKSYEATRRDSRYCSSSCRSSAHVRRTRGEAISDLAILDAPSGQVELALREYLDVRFLLDDPLATAALSLARRLDRDGDSLSGMAAALRALDAVIATLRAPVAELDGADPVDVLRFLRAVRRADPELSDTIRALLTDDVLERMRARKLATYPRRPVPAQES